MSSLAPRDDFPLLAGSPSLVYLDSAATSQKPRAVLDAMRDYYERDYANPHRGAYSISVRSTDRYLAARERVARFLGASDSSCVVFTRGTTESINLVAATWGREHVGSRDEIIITGAEHHANFVPWQQLALERRAALRICGLDARGRIDLDQLRSLVGPRTKLIAFSHVSNVLGTIAPVGELVALARAVGAITVCDGAQGVPHLPVTFDAMGVDFYAASAHKMLGPMGTGVLMGRREMLEAMRPYQMGGDMIEFVYDDRTTWNVLPHKFEAGTPNVAGAVGMAAACDYLDALGMPRVREHEVALVSAAMARLGAIEGVRIHGPPAAERSGVVSFTVGDIHPHDLATVLDHDGVCIRAGHHCAQPLMRRLGVPATARASFYVYSDEREIERLAVGVERARELFGYARV